MGGWCNVGRAKSQVCSKLRYRVAPMWCHERKQRSPFEPLLEVAVVVAALACSGWAAAEEPAAPTLKISGRAELDTDARAIADGYELRVLVADDAGRPLAGAELRVRADGSGLPTLRRCGNTRGESMGELVVTADASGRVCLTITGMSVGKVLLSYQDARSK
jgi:hypothetical protein